MATSPRTLDQVRNILGKLDRRIDALREARGTDGRPIPPVPGQSALIGQATPPPPTPPSPGQLIGGAPMRLTPAPAPVPPPAPSPSRSMYGRATPLRKAE